METKPLLYGLIGFFLGGFLVAVAATTFDKPANDPQITTKTDSAPMSMKQQSDDMTAWLSVKSGDEFDKAFLADMIPHHEGAIDMATLAAKNAKHDEIKQLSIDIMAAQDKEIKLMKQWQQDWGYSADNSHSHPTNSPAHSHGM